MVVTPAGTKPGDPPFWTKPRPGPFMLEPHDDIVESMPLETPAFFDDIQKTVTCLISVGHRLGVSVDTSEGKMEAMIHLVGSTAKDTLYASYTLPESPRHLLGLS